MRLMRMVSNAGMASESGAITNSQPENRRGSYSCLGLLIGAAALATVGGVFYVAREGKIRLPHYNPATETMAQIFTIPPTQAEDTGRESHRLVRETYVYENDGARFTFGHYFGKSPFVEMPDNEFRERCDLNIEGEGFGDGIFYLDERCDGIIDSGIVANLQLFFGIEDLSNETTRAIYQQYDRRLETLLEGLRNPVVTLTPTPVPQLTPQVPTPIYQTLIGTLPNDITKAQAYDFLYQIITRAFPTQIEDVNADTPYAFRDTYQVTDNDTIFLTLVHYYGRSNQNNSSGRAEDCHLIIGGATYGEGLEYLDDNCDGHVDYANIQVGTPTQYFQNLFVQEQVQERYENGLEEAFLRLLPPQ